MVYAIFALKYFTKKVILAGGGQSVKIVKVIAENFMFCYKLVKVS